MVEYVVCDVAWSRFHTCSFIMFSTSEILWLAIFRSSRCDTRCLKLMFIWTELRFTFTFNHSQQSYSRFTLDKNSLSYPAAFMFRVEWVWNKADLPKPLQLAFMPSLPTPDTTISIGDLSPHSIVNPSLLGTK